MKDYFLEIRNLSHKYTKHWAIKDIEFSIGKAGVFGLLGSNGAGKSTLMNIMCGALNQSKGTVIINGHDVRREPILAKKHIGFLPQKAPLYTDHTIDEYLAYCARLREMEKGQIPEALEWVKEKCGITHLSQRLIKNLSGGYQQRAGLAGAIIHRPDIVVLDEPVKGLDPIQINAIRDIIREIGKNRVVFFSSHNLSEVEALCDEIIMLSDGNLIFLGSLDKFKNYIQPSSILATWSNPPMNGELNGMDNIDQIDRIDDDQRRLKFNGSPDIIEDIIKLSVEKNWGLREIKLEKNSLDDIFSKLSRETPDNVHHEELISH